MYIVQYNLVHKESDCRKLPQQYAERSFVFLDYYRMFTPKRKTGYSTKTCHPPTDAAKPPPPLL